MTSTPSEPKTWANSQATNPPPTIAIRFGRLVDPHHRVARVDAAGGVDAVEAVDVEQVGARAGRDDHAVGRDLLTRRQREATLPDETGGRGIHGHVVLAAPVALSTRGDLVDPVGEDPVADGRPVDGDVAADMHPEPLGLARLEHAVGGQDEHLGRDATDVEAGAAERALLDDRDVEPLEPRG